MHDKEILKSVKENIEKEPYAKLLGVKVLLLEPGHSKVSMEVSADFGNIFGITHGGAVFSFMDIAFGSAVNSYGTVAVALNVSINYIKPARAGDILTAEAQEITRSKKVASFFIKAQNQAGEIIATAQSVAYLKNEKLPFLNG